MALVTSEQIVDQLSTLVEKEHLAEKLLERASRAPLDPREIAHLWNLATECRDHARILNRHRRAMDRHAEPTEYPQWKRGKGPHPADALEEASCVFTDLAGDYRSSVSLVDAPYLRKFLAILADEHARRAMELSCLATGGSIFADMDELEDSEAV